LNTWIGTVRKRVDCVVVAVLNLPFRGPATTEKPLFFRPVCVSFTLGSGAVSIPELSEKAVYSVVEVAQLCQLSKSQFHVHIRKKVFPPPVQNESCKRPYYTHELACKCVEIRQTGIGFSGQVVLFNRKAKKAASRQKAASAPAPVAPPEIVEAVRSLGLSVTTDLVAAAVENLFPTGLAGLD
jgi:hypothetical protein